MSALNALRDGSACKTGNEKMTVSFTVRDEVSVQASIERCFTLSTSIELVQAELGMHPVSGRTTGCVVDGDTVLWRGWKFCLPHTHESVIEAFKPPIFFRDRMISGRFAAFEHDHNFIPQPDGSVQLRDEMRFTLPWGALGTLVGRGMVVPHVKKLLRRRFAMIKRLAEGEGGFMQGVRSGAR